MLNMLKSKNLELPLFSVNSPEFSPFGRVLTGLNVAEIIAEAGAITAPESGSSYLPAVTVFEKLPIAKVIEEELFGEMPTQVGYCFGHNNLLNGAEWHTSSEINIAVTPLVLLLAPRQALKNNQISSNEFKAFYLPAGTAVEVYATTLHFSPCEVQKEGFGCVVALPKGTNTELEQPATNPYLFRKNKWLLAHCENKNLQKRGARPGITGENLQINY